IAAVAQRLDVEADAVESSGRAGCLHREIGVEDGHDVARHARDLERWIAREMAVVEIVEPLVEAFAQGHARCAVVAGEALNLFFVAGMDHVAPVQTSRQPAVLLDLQTGPGRGVVDDGLQDRYVVDDSIGSRDVGRGDQAGAGPERKPQTAGGRRWRGVGGAGLTPAVPCPCPVTPSYSIDGPCRRG